MKIIAATQNTHKIQEISKITEAFGFELISAKAAGIDADPEENGSTFAENSFIKANAICMLSGMPSLADDSGLCVDALNAAPGVYSARFGGEHGNDALNRKTLLDKLKDVPDEKRGAAFHCVITLLWPDGRKIVAGGICRGRIIREERGENGFGYDSLFVPDGYDKTFAELSPEIKNSISHRADALNQLQAELLKMK